MRRAPSVEAASQIEKERKIKQGCAIGFVAFVGLLWLLIWMSAGGNGPEALLLRDSGRCAKNASESVRPEWREDAYKRCMEGGGYKCLRRPDGVLDCGGLIRGFALAGNDPVTTRHNAKRCGDHAHATIPPPVPSTIAQQRECERRAEDAYQKCMEASGEKCFRRSDGVLDCGEAR